MTAPVDDSVPTVAPTVGGTYVWDGSQYHYNWSTKGFQTGYYWLIVVHLDDGQTCYVFIGLR